MNSINMKKVVAFPYPVLLLSFVLAAFSTEGDQSKTKTDLLTEKSWILTKIEYQSPNAVFEIPIDNCKKDDIISFTRQGNYMLQVGADNCNAGQQNVSGTWLWKANETILSLTSDGDTNDNSVLKLEGSKLKINMGQHQYDQNADGIDDITVSYLYTFTAQ